MTALEVSITIQAAVVMAENNTANPLRVMLPVTKVL